MIKLPLEWCDSFIPHASVNIIKLTIRMNYLNQNMIRVHYIRVSNPYSEAV